MTDPLQRPAPFAWLARLSVSRKIALGFGAVLALHLSVVALGHYGLKRAQHDRATQAALHSRVETFYGIDRALAELERNVLLFAFTGYHGPEQRVEALEELLLELIDSLDAAPSEDHDLRVDPTLLTDLRNHLHRRREVFQAVVSDRGKRRSLLEVDLEAHTQRFALAFERLGESAQSDLGLLRVQNQFSLARLHALRFAITPDSSHVRAAKKRLANVVRLLDEQEGDHSAETLAELRDAASRFESAFIQMVLSTRGYLHLVNVVLAGESEEFLRLTRDARTNYLQRADRLSERIERNADRFSTMNHVVSVLTILLGVGAAGLIRRDLVPPLSAISATFDRLAGGETCDSIPGGDRGDELGRLAHAAEVFRAKASETERLLAEVTRMKDLERQVAHSQKMESIGQLAAGIAHEVNTPMQAVVNNVDFIAKASELVLAEVEGLRLACRRDDAGGAAWREEIERRAADSRLAVVLEQMPAALDDTAQASRRVVEIVRAMRTLSHPGKAGNEPVDVNQLIRDASVVTRNHWKEVAVCEFDLDESLPMPEASANALSQVVLNLIVNAADAIADAPPRPDSHGETVPGVIQLTTYADAESVYIEVADTGPGVPADVRRRVFDPFFTTKEVGKGTGQGLALCYDVIVRQHRGKLTVTDRAGGGALFTAQLPIVATDAEPTETGQADAPRLPAPV